MPTLSVVIPSAVRPDLLALCLASVARHAPAGAEILVVDDASPNGEASVAAVRFPGVRVLRLPRRAGFAVATNAGIAATLGEVVEVLNDDAEVSAGWADAALREFADARVGSVAPLVLQSGRPGATVIDSAGDGYDSGGFAFKRGHGEPLPADGPLLTPGNVWGTSATAGFYRRAALNQVGCFPADFGAYFEDVDLAFRLNRAGWRCRYAPDSVVRHRVSASYGRRPGRRVLEMQSRNEERVFWRNTRGRALLRALPRHAAVLAGKAARRQAEGALAPWLAGRARALAGVVRGRV